MADELQPRWQVRVCPKGYVQPFLLTAAWVIWCVVVLTWYGGPGGPRAPMWELVTTWLGWVPVAIAWGLAEHFDGSDE